MRIRVGRRGVVAWVAATAVATIAVAGTAAAAPPSGVNYVWVTADETTVGVNADLQQGATINGVITQAGNGQPTSAAVVAYQGGREVAGDYTSSGQYSLTGLATGSYVVCATDQSSQEALALRRSGRVEAPKLIRGGVGAGLLGQCYQGVLWNGNTEPTGAEQLHVSAPNTFTGVDLALPPASEISGRVTTPTGGGINEVIVTAQDPATGFSASTNSGPDGSYQLSGLAPSAKGYRVCFRFYESQLVDFQASCYHNKTFVNGAPPSTVTPVVVGTNQIVTVNEALPVGGDIAGTITSAQGGKPLADIWVTVFTSKGAILGRALANAHGYYVMRGLPAATSDRVCAGAPSYAVPPTLHYSGLCWIKVAWNGQSLPHHTADIRVRINHATLGINLRLPVTTVRLGSLSGRITAGGGQSLVNAVVAAYGKTGTDVSAAYTDASGRYNLTELPAGTYRICVSPQDATSPTPPTNGWSPQCYGNAAWDGGPLPTHASSVVLAAGQKRTGLNIAVPDGGRITGTVRQAGSAAPLAGHGVVLFDRQGVNIGDTTTDSSGDYSFAGLAPGQAAYAVCFDGGALVPDGSGDLSQCFDNVAWNG